MTKKIRGMKVSEISNTLNFEIKRVLYDINKLYDYLKYSIFFDGDTYDTFIYDFNRIMEFDYLDYEHDYNMFIDFDVNLQLSTNLIEDKINNYVYDYNYIEPTI
jgi:hypothetical protein